VAGTTLLGHLRELHGRDEVLGRELARLEALEDEIRRVRERAEELGRFFTRLPEERDRIRDALAGARVELERRAAEARLAEGRLEEAQRANDERAVRDASHAFRRARDAVGVAERRHAALEGDRADLELRAAAGEAETGSLEAAALEASARLESTARISATGRAAPGAGLGGLSSWASRARAAVFVVRAGLEREREPLLRQANELVSATIGEPLYAATVALALRRLEAHSQPA